MAKKYHFCIRHSGVSLTKNPASQQRNTKEKYRISDPIRCLALMRLAARSQPSHGKHETRALIGSPAFFRPA